MLSSNFMMVPASSTMSSTQSRRRTPIWIGFAAVTGAAVVAVTVTVATVAVAVHLLTQIV